MRLVLLVPWALARLVLNAHQLTTVELGSTRLAPALQERVDALSTGLSTRAVALVANSTAAAATANGTAANGTAANGTSNGSSPLTASVPNVTGGSAVTPHVAPPAAAAASSVGVAPPDAHVTDAAPEFLARMHQPFAIQFVGVQDDGTPRSSLDVMEDHCLAINHTAKEELGGYALEFRHCHHQDLHQQPWPVEMQWFLQADGTIASAWVPNSTDGARLCVRERKCRGTTVYDAGSCFSKMTFGVSQTLKGRVDILKPLGTPLHGIVGPGQIHGPFQLYGSCEGVMTGHGCEMMRPKAGWTRMPTQYLGSHDFMSQKDIAAQELAKELATRSEELASGDLTANRDAAMADMVAGAVEFGVGMGEDHCGTMLADGPRTENWWYFVRAGDIP